MTLLVVALCISMVSTPIIFTGEIQMDISIVNLLEDWIINHKLAEDRQYGPYYNDKHLSPILNRLLYTKLVNRTV